MRKVLLTVIAILLLLMCMGCDVAGGQSYLAFRQSEIRVSVKGDLELVRTDGYIPEGACAGVGSDGRVLEFEALITSSRADDGSLASRVEFTAPVSLKGFEIDYSESGAKFTLKGQKSVSSGAFSLKIPNICSAFYIGETVTSVDPQSDGDIEIYLGNGDRSPCAIYVFDKGASLPKQIKATTDDFKLHLWDIVEIK